MKRNLLIVMLLMSLCGCGDKRFYDGTYYRGEYSVGAAVGSEYLYSKMDAVSSWTEIMNDCYEENVIVILNQAEVTDYEECANEIIRRYLVNDFESIKFSYDMNGYPKELNVTVFMNEKDFKEWVPLAYVSIVCETEKWKYIICQKSE